MSLKISSKRRHRRTVRGSTPNTYVLDLGRGMRVKAKRVVPLGFGLGLYETNGNEWFE